MCGKQKIDLFKMESLFKTFQNRSVIILVTGTITIPFYIKKFDWAYRKDQISFGEFEDVDNWFYLDYEDIKEILYEYDSPEDKLLFICHFDIFTTYIEVIYDCSLRVGEQDE